MDVGNDALYLCTRFGVEARAAEGVAELLVVGVESDTRDNYGETAGDEESDGEDNERLWYVLDV